MMKSKVSSTSKRRKRGEIQFAVVVRQLGRRHEKAFHRGGIAFVRRPETRRDESEMPRRVAGNEEIAKRNAG